MLAKFRATASDGTDMMPTLAAFAESLGLENIAKDRYSLALVLGLFGGREVQNPHKVVHEIKALEGMGEPSQFKGPISFNHPPLNGLWHQHYLRDGIASAALNLRRGIKEHGIPLFQQRADAQSAGEIRYVTTADIPEIAADAVQGNWLRLARDGNLTGEWIVFAKHQGKNYYLCLGTHDAGDDYLRSQIDAICCQEFPFLRDLLA